MTDLGKLIEAVEAGECPDFCPRWHGNGMCMEAEAAFDGDLSAAHRLHEALLPGWGWAVEGEDACVWHPDTRGVSRDMATAPHPARAWLLAVLRALKAQGGDA